MPLVRGNAARTKKGFAENIKREVTYVRNAEKDIRIKLNERMLLVSRK